MQPANVKQGIDEMLADTIASQGLAVIYSKLKPFETGDAHYWEKANDDVLLSPAEQKSITRISQIFIQTISVCTTEIGIYGTEQQRAVNFVMAVSSLEKVGDRQFDVQLKTGTLQVMKGNDYPVSDFVMDLATMYGATTKPVANDYKGKISLDFSGVAPEQYRGFDVFLKMVNKNVCQGTGRWT